MIQNIIENKELGSEYCSSCYMIPLECYCEKAETNEDKYIKGDTPNYYTGKYKGIKAIDVIHDFELSHCKASALEYILRSGKKDDEVQDLTKAINHLNMQIKFIKDSAESNKVNYIYTK